ncbi:phosphoglycerate mutase-like protein [Sarocladium strictum]
MNLVLGLLATGFLYPGLAVAETVHGTAKWYGAAQLTSLGAEQVFQVGTSFRERYLASSSKMHIAGISEDQYVGSQIYPSAPDQPVLLNTASAFLQGLYPPLGDVAPDLASQTLNNGSESSSPLDGKQYVVLHVQDDESPNTVWIKGDDQSTRDFYEGFYDVLEPGVYNVKPENMTYKNAYGIFDLINVARIHNETSPARNVSDQDLFQLRTLADSAEHALKWNASQKGDPRAIGAETLSGAILAKLNQTVATKGRLKFSLLVGSYDTFLAFFGLAGLLGVSDDFYGLPDYASTITFELFSDSESFPSSQNALSVRWLFKNGTDGDMKTFPLFGTGDDALSWPDFHARISELAVSDVGTWCDRCEATADFCAAFDPELGSGFDAKEEMHGQSMPNAVAGVIGAFVALGVAGLVAGFAFLFLRRRHRGRGSTAAEAASLQSSEKEETNQPAVLSA